MATSTVDMFFIGNFADMDTDESDMDNENPGVVLGLYDNLQFVSVTQNDVDDDGVIYDDEMGTGDFLSYDAGSGPTDVALDSSSLYDADILLGDGSTMSVPVLVLQSANGDVFVSEYPPFPLDGLAIQSIDLVSLNTSEAAGINRGTSDMQGTTAVCFAAGTAIATPLGSRIVEDLAAGDQVTTLENGAQTVLWVRKSDHVLGPETAGNQPIELKAGALGANSPAQTLVVSPQHRILVGGAGQLEGNFTGEVLVPAKALLGLSGVRTMSGKRRITWVHFACAGHEIVLANGCASESLLLGPMALSSLSKSERREVTRIFGCLEPQSLALNGPPARPCLTVKQARAALELGPKKRNPSNLVGAHCDDPSTGSGWRARRKSVDPFNVEPGLRQ